MKKIYLTILFIFSFLLSFGQLDMTFGVSSYALKTKQNSDIGFGFGFNLKHFHWDISHNVFEDKADNYNVNGTRINYGVTNVGYNFHAGKDIVVTPVIGYGWTNTDSIKMMYSGSTYQLGDPVPHLNVGFLLTKYCKRVGFGVGFGTFEFFKFNVNIKLIN